MSAQLGRAETGGEVLNFSSREKVVARSSSRHEEPSARRESNCFVGHHVALKEQFRHVLIELPL